MTKSLLIVESAKKAKTISGMLGAGYTVKATSGHILEMPADDIHVNLTDFTPTLYLMRGKGKTLEALKAAAAGADAIYLATDMDREGEAIAAHVADRLGAAARGKVRRITFTAITQADIRAALANPRQIDRRLVEAQTARRVIDRLVGYMVSPVLWAGLSGRKRLSAGRVQSPALWLVVQREREIAAFVPEEWWSIRAELSRQADDPPQKFWAALFKIKGKKPELKTQADADRVLSDLRGAAWRVQAVEKGTRLRRPYPPFTTDSLQQAASSQLGFNPRLTMKIAQELYEGVKLGEGKAVGLITYIRTDSVAVAPEAQRAAREVIAKYFGEAYLPPKAPVYQTRDKSAQEAHEAIRPVDPWRTPKGIEQHLTAQQHKLYRLIWRRFVASQMRPAVYDTVTVDVETRIGDSPTVYLFRATGSTLTFAGFLKVYGVDVDAEESRRQKPAGKGDEDDDGSADNEQMPDLRVGDPLRLHQLLPKQHFTQPPNRFTEAQLIGQLKKLGLGRPSTYATIVETLKERLYVGVEQKRLFPTPLGVQVCELLERHVGMAVDVGFTAQMEEDLDRIARGQAERVAVMRQFYGPFKAMVDTALAAARENRQPAAKVEAARKRSPRAAPKSEKEGQPCPLCGKGVLQMKRSKYGPFLGCSRYKQGCTYTEKVATRRKSSSRRKGAGKGRRKKG
ncbi:MAG: type I DNA topoisomerase [Anaerolineae bacterium]